MALEPGSRLRRVEDEALEETNLSGPIPFGGDQTIDAILNKKSGKGEAYIVRTTDESGVVREFRLAKKQGDDLINARMASLSRQVSQRQQIEGEVFQSLMPTYIAEEYRNKLRSLNVPEEMIPQTTHEMIEMAKKELLHYKDLGQAQIALDAQKTADLMLEITNEVLQGNNLRYNNLPPEFKLHIKNNLPALNALMAQHAGINEETVEAAKKLFQIKTLESEVFRDSLLSHVTATSEVAGKLLGNLLGPTLGAIKATGDLAYEGVREKVKELSESRKNKRRS